MRYWYIYIIALVAVGCEKDLDFDNPDYTPKLVVNGFTSADSLLSINISKSTPTLTEPSMELLTGKTKVLVLKDELLLYSDSVILKDGKVIVPFKPIEGSTYELQVGYAGLPTIKAIDNVPTSRPQVRVDTLLEEENKYRLVFYLKDSPEQNRYVINLRVHGKEKVGLDSIQASYSVPFNSSDKIFLSNIRTVANGRELAIFNDETWNGTERRIEFLIDKTSINLSNFKVQHLELDVKDISKTMYEYYIAVNSNTHVYGGPLASVSRVVGNVEQGLGAFCFYTESATILTLP